jgi:phosphoenolpyruvate carboxykinase (GTP)
MGETASNKEIFVSMTQSPVTTAPTAFHTPTDVQAFVDQWAEIFQPDAIEWCDGSIAEKDRLISLMVSQGTLEPLNAELRPYSFIARSAPSDVARVESRTFICSPSADDAGPTNNWVEPGQMKTDMLDVMAGSMRGRTMYVVPFSMGPIDSPLSRFGVQLTDSPYVVVSLHTMVRVSSDLLEIMNAHHTWVRCVHTVGAPLAEGDVDVAWPANDTKYISHFPESKEIWSFGSAYGGNALLPKKAFALRIASVMAKEEGWLAEHMLLVRVTSPEGKVYHLAAAFPSACGKTNFAMMQPTLPGWKVETLGDDITWLAKGPRGELRAINPEAGFFGVAPGTSRKTNPIAMDTLWGNTIFTNVATTSEGDVWWEGMTKTAPQDLTDWQGNAYDHNSVATAAHPNARFTVGIHQCPTLGEGWDDPEGVAIDAIIFGGRRSDTVPLVMEARDWNHGVFLGSTIASEQTAAAEGPVGKVRRDPFAMVPFCGYNMADYFQHWFDVGSDLRENGHTPRIFQVNWFSKNADGQFIWPGFGDNIRVVKWMVDRIEGRTGATHHPMGLLPQAGSLDVDGLDLSDTDLDTLLSPDTDRVLADLDDAEEFLGGFDKKLPTALLSELQRIRDELTDNTGQSAAA